MTKWNEIELGQVRGISTNIDYPGINYAQEILNLHPHIYPQKLVLRKGYKLKYDYPLHSYLENITSLNFDILVDRKENEQGTEVTILIQKATVKADGLSGITDKEDILCFWARPYFDGTAWIDSWEWLNEIIISKIESVSATYKNNITIFGGIDQQITENKLIGWTIYNKTKNDYARIITATEVDSNSTRINITKYENNWEVNDTIYLCKNYIDLQALRQLYYVNWEDIVIHKVLDDLRIGFGGKENRPALAIGFRKTSYLFRQLDYPNLHPLLQDENNLRLFAEKSGIIIDTTILTTKKGIYGIDLYTEENGDLELNKYYFRMTGVIDGYQEQLLAENEIIAGAEEYISIYPYVRLGIDNIRLTKLILYYSIDDINYYKIREYQLKDEEYNNVIWKVDKFGRMIVESSFPEKLNEANAVSVVNEQNTQGSWVTHRLNGSLQIDTSANSVDNYSFKITVNSYGGQVPDKERQGIRIPVSGLKKGEKYNLSVQMKSQVDDLSEDFEDTNYDSRILIDGFARVSTSNPRGSWHLQSGASQSPPNTQFPNGNFVMITIDKPKILTFYARGNVGVYKKIGSNNPETLLILNNEDSGTYTSNNLVTVEINELAKNVKIYIVHEPIAYGVDNEGQFIGIWDDLFIDDIQLSIAVPNRYFYAYLLGDSLSEDEALQEELTNIGTAYSEQKVTLMANIDEEPKYLVIANRPIEDEQTIFWVDKVSLKEKDLVSFQKKDIEEADEEITDLLGYTPSYNMVRGWDMALTFRGRTYYLNPYIDKRYEDMIFISNIAPPGIYQWDLANFSNYRELEKYDNDKAIGMAFLPTTELLILKGKSVTSIDPETGAKREPIYGTGCVSKHTIVNIGNSIYWAGNEDIYRINLGQGFAAQPLLIKSIRGDYSTIASKNKLFAVRDKYNTYRIRVEDENKEYLFIGDDIIKEKRFDYAHIYRYGDKGILNFMDKYGNIYRTDPEYYGYITDDMGHILEDDAGMILIEGVSS